MREAALLVAIATLVGHANGESADARQAAGGVSHAIRTTISADAIQPGAVAVLTVTGPEPIDGVTVRAFGRDVPAYRVDARTWQALIGVDVDARPGPSTVTVEARSTLPAYRDAIALRVRPRTFPTRSLKVDPSFVNPPRDAQPRIEKEARLLADLWATATPSRLWSGRFVRPVPGSSSSRFGAQSIFNGQPRGRHLGEDFSGKEGTPVVAPNAGRVAIARDLYFSGNTVVIDHGLGLFSLLAHLSTIDVKEGDAVPAGRQMGRVGSTGRVTGPHLHWAVRLNGARLDPLSLLEIAATDVGKLDLLLAGDRQQTRQPVSVDELLGPQLE